MKKLLTILLFAVMAVCLTLSFVGCNIDVSHPEIEGTDGLEYFPLDDGTYAVACGTTKYLSQIVIPAKHNGKSVSAISDNGFNGCNSLESITIPNSITRIGYRAFSYCRTLTNITIPNSVTIISDEAFNSCSSLTNLTIPDSVTTIGSHAFAGCDSVTSITIGNGVTQIFNYAFDCTALTEIKYNAINCNDFTSDNRVFYNAGQNGSGITVTIGKDVTKIPANFFCHYDNPYSYDPSHSPKITSVVFEDGSKCESIGEYAFYNCNNLTSITIPDSVISIGDYSFYDCGSLESVTIGRNVTNIGYRAFGICNGLTSATFKDVNGWNVCGLSDFSYATMLSSTELSDTATAAEYLSSTYYCAYYWKKG